MRLPTQLRQRNPKAHKGDFGHIFILAGSNRFSGAGLLCAAAAMRSGAGLVTLGVPQGINLAVLKNKSKEVMTLSLPETSAGTLSLRAYPKILAFLKSVDVLVLGPGLGKDRSTYALVRKIMASLKLPSVVDADALNALSNYLKLLVQNKGRVILTPHEMEFSRLFKAPLGQIKKNRKLIAQKYAKHYNSLIVLKGHQTIVTDGCKKYYLNRTGNPGMATAGSGDVLSGIIGAFLGQGLDIFSAAKYATYIHGLAGDLAAKDKTEIGLVASDIIDKIPEALKKSINLPA